MEKIKNIINPGKSKDDEVMYGSGQSDDPVHTGTGTQATSSHNTNNPIPSSTEPAGNTSRDPVGQGGIGSVQQGSQPVSSSRMPGTSDDDVGSTSSIKSGVPGSNQESRVIGAPETHDTLDTNKPLPHEPTTGAAHEQGSSTTSGVGPHSSGLANKADPRVDSDLDGSRGLGSHGTTGTTGAYTGSELPDRSVGGSSTTTDSGRSFPLGGAAAAGTTTSGPHDSGLANKADPRVDSDRDGSRGLGGAGGYGTGTGATVGSAHQGDLSRSGPGGITGAKAGESLPPVDYSEKTWTHDHNKLGHDFAGDPCANEAPAPGAPHFTSGPHSLDTANRLDPHVSGGGLSSGPSTTTDPSTSSAGHHHLGRDAGLGAGAGAVGVGAYEAGRDVPSSSTTATGHDRPGRDAGLGAGTAAAGAGTFEAGRDVPGGSTAERERTTAGPHASDMMNKVDPRVDSDLSQQQGTSASIGATDPRSTSTTGPSTSREHHPGRDAALGGAGGVAAYEGVKHHDRDRDVPQGSSTLGYGDSSQDTPASSGYANPYPPGSGTTGVGSGPSSSVTHPSGLGTTGVSSGPISSTTPGTATSTDSTSTGKDHHYARDAGIVGAGAGAAYEADKHFRGPHGDTTGTSFTEPTSTHQAPSGTSAPGYGRDTGLTGAGATGHPESRHQPSATSGLAGQPPVYEERTRPQEAHTGRDAALGAGAGAAAAVGGQEFSKKEAERAHEEELKQQKAAHKQEEKAAKHHQHEVEKAEKKHHHDLEKAEKAHEKKLEKEEAKHHKEESKEHEKKHHHGLLGFLHRDKPDKELKEEEAARKERLEQESHPGTGTTAAGAGGALAGTEGLSEMEKHQRAKEHDRNRLHKDPPPGYGQPEYAEPPTKGYASQVTGGTGTTALAQGEPVPRGSHATGLGNKTDPSVAGRGETVDSNQTRDSEGRVVEPHTGLPLDINKGDGTGGTDDTPVHGYHAGQSGTHGTTAGSSSGGEGFGHFQDHAR